MSTIIFTSEQHQTGRRIYIENHSSSTILKPVINQVKAQLDLITIMHEATTVVNIVELSPTEIHEAILCKNRLFIDKLLLYMSETFALKPLRIVELECYPNDGRVGSGRATLSLVSETSSVDVSMENLGGDDTHILIRHRGETSAVIEMIISVTNDPLSGYINLGWNINARVLKQFTLCDNTSVNEHVEKLASQIVTIVPSMIEECKTEASSHVLISL